MGFMTHMLMKDLWNVVAAIRSSKTPLGGVEAFERTEKSLLATSPQLLLPSLIEVVENSPAWTVICIASVYLMRACDRMNADRHTRARATVAIRNAYEPQHHHVDKGMTEAAKMIALAGLNDHIAIRHLESNARNAGYQNIEEYLGVLFAHVLAAIAMLPDEQD